ncbi:hypothetical protein FHN97_21950 [Salmonella enterica]|nr:hypothetical protein [Salmonella enterica]EBO5289900.1 hypothetical protein [Salmonella enterica subsp. enterica serovar Typhimurium]EBV5819408.1 hypothetical protein [Salmonella enterica subsp. enterica serovar Cubana]ECF7044608.1 hypothetical protein [Salmonella enterica subsp. enterica]EAT6829294.1 hypothetical protein [Salmonella enterica]
MLSKTGFTHSDLLCWQIDYAGGSLNVNGTIMRDTYTADIQGEIKVTSGDVVVDGIDVKKHHHDTQGEYAPTSEAKA